MSNANGDTATAALLYLHAQTSLHPGSGTALDVVDLPIQRERHTQWPVIPGSALKGILRDSCREEARSRHGGDRRKTNEEDPQLVAVFGPARLTGEANPHAGAIAVNRCADSSLPRKIASRRLRLGHVPRRTPAAEP